MKSNNSRKRRKNRFFSLLHTFFLLIPFLRRFICFSWTEGLDVILGTMKKPPLLSQRTCRYQLLVQPRKKYFLSGRNKFFLFNSQLLSTNTLSDTNYTSIFLSLSVDYIFKKIAIFSSNSSLFRREYLSANTNFPFRKLLLQRILSYTPRFRLLNSHTTKIQLFLWVKSKNLSKLRTSDANDCRRRFVRDLRSFSCWTKFPLLRGIERKSGAVWVKCE